jgi:hypothetical protein
MPLMVRSPTTVQSAPSVRTSVERKVIVVWLPTSKKSAERMCASRCSCRVSIESMSIVAVTVDCAGSSAVTISPENSVK